MDYCSIMLIVVLFLVLVFFFYQHYKPDVSQKNSLLQTLHLVQYRYQCDPHCLLNQINSLASQTTRLNSTELQTRIIEFGRGLRRNLTYSTQILQTINQQIEESEMVIKREYSQTIPPVNLNCSLETTDIVWQLLPSHILPNLVKAILRANNQNQIKEIRIEFRMLAQDVLITFNPIPHAHFELPKGLPFELLCAQKNYFNSVVKNSFSINFDNSNPVNCSFKVTYNTRANRFGSTK